MAKELILLGDVAGLGIVGDIVKVSDGYARNFLLPKKMAGTATEATIAKVAVRREEREAELAKELVLAEALAEKIASTSITIPVKLTESGKLFGSVSVNDLLEKAKENKLEINNKQLLMDAPIKEVGVYNLNVRLHPQVKAKLKVWIVEE